MQKQKLAFTILLLFALAAVLYNSWPLGYMVNSQTAHYGLASDLELVGQPYYWLFVTGDVLAGLCVIGAVGLMQRTRRPEFQSTVWALIFVGIILFGLFTAVSALLPSQCSVTPVFRCGAVHGHGLGLDAVTSSIAAFGLLLGLIGVSLSNRSLIRGKNVAHVSRVVLAAWCLSGLVFVKLAISNGNAHLPQEFLLTLSGIALLAIGLRIFMSVLETPARQTNR